MIDPADIPDWDEYYNDISTLDEILEHDEECVQDACQMMTAFSDRFHTEIVGFIRTRWLTPVIKRGEMSISDSAPFENSFELVSAAVAEGYMEVSPKVVAEANEKSSAYTSVVKKLQAYARDYMHDWFDTYSTLVRKTLLDKVYDAEGDDEIEVEGTDWLDAAHEDCACSYGDGGCGGDGCSCKDDSDPDEGPLPITVVHNAIVYLALDDVHYLRMPFVGGEFDSKSVEATEMSADQETRDTVLRGEGEKLGMSIYVAENPSDKVHVESMTRYIHMYLNGEEE